MLARLCIALVVSLGAAGTASAETQLSRAGVWGLTAARGWVSWIQPDDQLRPHWQLWHRGGLVASPEVEGRTLGTDPKGRAVALEWPCSGCRAVERRLPDGSVRPLPRRVVHAADEHAGTLAYVRRGLGIYLLRRGARHVVRVSRADASTIALGQRWLVYWHVGGPDETDTLAAIDLSRAKPRELILATDDHSDERCCSDTVQRERRPTVDGHHAYWVETLWTGIETSHPQYTTTVLRADLDAKRPVVERFSPLHKANDLTVDGGTVYYSEGDIPESAGTFRARSPRWTWTPDELPVYG
jgi:hypothetical protein